MKNQALAVAFWIFKALYVKLAHTQMHLYVYHVLPTHYVMQNAFYFYKLRQKQYKFYVDLLQKRK